MRHDLRCHPDTSMPRLTKSQRDGILWAAVTRLIFVRHGESNTTVARRIGGYRTCTGLSPLGRLQSERLRQRWAEAPDFTADALISSQFPRARETAEIISPALGGLPIEVVDGF